MRRTYVELCRDRVRRFRLAELVNQRHILTGKFRAFPSTGIGRIGNGLKMGRVHAAAYAAQMVKLHPFRDWTNETFVDEPVRLEHASVMASTAISGPVKRSLPNPARRAESAVFFDVVRHIGPSPLMTSQEPVWLALGKTKPLDGLRRPRRFVATTAVAKAVGDVIVWLRHFRTSWLGLGCATAGGLPAARLFAVRIIPEQPFDLARVITELGGDPADMTS